MPTTAHDDDDKQRPDIQQDRLWQDQRWTAQVIKNEDDEGWAVAMTLAGESEPALVGPWTMGRDKKNPKPLDINAFNTLVKTASEVLRRHEQQLHAQLNQSLLLQRDQGTVEVRLRIVPDEYEPYGLLSAHEPGEPAAIAEVKVKPGFKLSRASASAWVEAGFERPGR